MVFWEGYVSDEMMGTFAPIVIYWLYAGVYQLLPPLDRFRLHTRKEEEQKNLVPMATVIKGVLLQQLIQATIARILFLASHTFQNQKHWHALLRNNKASVIPTSELLNGEGTLKDEFVDIDYPTLYAKFGDVELSELEGVDSWDGVNSGAQGASAEGKS